MRGTTLLKYQGHENAVWKVVWSPDGKFLASGSDDMTSQVWDATTGQHICTFYDPDGSPLALAWSPDSKKLASDANETNIQIWNSQTCEVVLTLARFWGVSVLLDEHREPDFLDLIFT